MSFTFKLVDVIVEIGVSFIIAPIFLGIALTNMAAQSTTGWADTTVMLWGLLGMIFIAAMIIATISHAKYAGKIP